jgi:hypothetical protein
MGYVRQEMNKRRDAGGRRKKEIKEGGQRGTKGKRRKQERNKRREME